MIILKNAYLPDKNGLFNIIIENHKISDIYPLEKELPSTHSFKEIDLNGKQIFPGFIDIHIQGAGGGDFLDSNMNSIEKITKTLIKNGITAVLATTVINDKINNAHLKFLSEISGKTINGVEILGIYLEGPFINPIKRGGISINAIKNPNIKTLYEILELCNEKLKIMTIAPELQGIDEIINILIKNNVIPSFGHSNANYEETKKAINKGMRHITHVFNAMQGIHHRNPGPIIAFLETENVFYEIISDGYHIHPSIVNFIYKNVGIDNCICITDGMRASGLGDGIYTYNGKKFITKKGLSMYEDGTLIGSAKPLFEIAKEFSRFTKTPLPEALKTITINPAKALNINKIGKIEKGYYADIVIIENNIIKSVISKGKIVK